MIRRYADMLLRSRCHADDARCRDFDGGAVKIYAADAFSMPMPACC